MKPDKRSRRTLGSILLALLTQLQLLVVPTFAAATANGSHPEWQNFYDVADHWTFFSVGRQLGQFLCSILGGFLNFIEEDVFTAIFANSEAFFERTASHVFGSHAHFMSIVSAFLIIGLVSYGVWIILHNEQTSNSSRFMARQIIAFIGVFLLIPGVLGSFWGFLGKSYKASAKAWATGAGSDNSPTAECINSCVTDWYWLAGKGAVQAEKSSDSDADADAGDDAATTDNSKTDDKKKPVKITKNGDLHWNEVQAKPDRIKGNGYHTNSSYTTAGDFYTCAPETGYIGWSIIEPEQYMTEDGIDDYNNEVKGAPAQQKHISSELTDGDNGRLSNHERRKLNAKWYYYGNLQYGQDKDYGGLISEDVKNNVFTCDASGNKIKAAQSSSDSGANVLKVIFNHGIGSPPYYRYTIDWIPLIVELFALSVFYLAIAFKILRILFDTIITGVVAPFFVAIDFWGESGQRTKTVYRSIVNAMLSIFALLLEIEFFTFFCSQIPQLGKGLPWTGKLGVEALGYLALCYIGIKGADIFKKMNLDVDNSMEMSQIAKGGKAVANAAGKAASGAIGLAAGTALAKAGAHEINKADKAAKAAKNGRNGSGGEAGQLQAARNGGNGKNGGGGAAKNPKDKDGKKDEDRPDTALNGSSVNDELTQNNFEDEESRGSALEGDKKDDKDEKTLGGGTAETGEDNTNGSSALEQGEEGDTEGGEKGNGSAPQTREQAEAAKKEALGKAATSATMAAETVAALSQDGGNSKGDTGETGTSDTATGGAKGTAKKSAETKTQLSAQPNGEGGTTDESGTNIAAASGSKATSFNGNSAVGGESGQGGTSEQTNAEPKLSVKAQAPGTPGEQANLENGGNSAPAEAPKGVGTSVPQNAANSQTAVGDQPTGETQVGGTSATGTPSLGERSNAPEMPNVGQAAAQAQQRRMEAVPVEATADMPSGNTGGTRQMSAPQQPSGQPQAQNVVMGDNAQINVVAGQKSNINNAGGHVATPQANVGETYASAAAGDSGDSGYVSDGSSSTTAGSGSGGGGYARMTVDNPDGSRVTFESAEAISAASGGGDGGSIEGGSSSDSPQISAQSEMASNWGTGMMSGHATGKQAERAASYARMGKQGQRIANVVGHEMAWSNNRKMRSNVRKATQQAYMEQGGSKAAGFAKGRIEARKQSVKSYAHNKVNEYVGYAAGNDKDKSNSGQTYADRSQVIGEDTRPQGNMNDEDTGN